MNKTASEFWGYPKDAYTTLPETRDPILATSVNASWRVRLDAVAVEGGAGTDCGAAFAVARSTVLSTFAVTYTYSLQQMLCTTIGEALLWRCRRSARCGWPCRTSISYQVDLAPFGLSNEREVYLAEHHTYGLDRGDRAGRRRPGRGYRLDLAGAL